MLKIRKWHNSELHKMECAQFGILQKIKVAIFQKVRCVFSNLKISKKKIFQKTILNLKFEFPAKNTLLLLAGNLNFKLRIIFWNIFIWRFEKTNCTF